MMKRMKRILGYLLVMAMIFAVAGCGKEDNESSQTEKKDFYYVPSYQELNLDIDYINQVAAVGDKLYFVGYAWDDETEEGSEQMYSYNMTSNECKKISLAMEENASVQQMVSDGEETLFLIVNKYVPIENTDTESINEKEVGAEEAEEEVSADSYEEPIEYENYMELWKVSAKDGSVISQTDITSVFENTDGFWAQYMAVDVQRNLYICSYSDNGDTAIYVLDQNGSKICTISMADWIEGMFLASDGKVYFRAWNDTGTEIKPIDVKEKKAGDAVKCENLDTRGTYDQKFFLNADKALFVSDSKGVFHYDIESDTREDLFDWIDVDINSDAVSVTGQLLDGRFFAVLQENTNESSEYSIAILTKTPAKEVVQKEEIVFGTMWLDQNLQKAIVDFNKANEKYHITVKEYAIEDYQVGLTQLNNDITSGNCPDIIDISNIDFKQYANKGILEDLYPYMEEAGINREDYLENVFKACEVDGKLYGVIPQFTISTTVAKASKVGEIPGWTLKDMLDFVEKSDADNVFINGSRIGIFYYCIYNNIDDFINWETGECYFNGEDFIRTLEFAAEFPEEVDYTNDEEGTSAKLRSDKVLLMQTGVSSVQEYQMMNGLFGEKVTYIGYPNSEGKGNLIAPANGSVALSSSSEHKEEAFAFIAMLLSEEYQDSLVSGVGFGWGFPISKAALEKKFQDDMMPSYYEDENGEKQELAKTSWGYDDFSMEIYAATQEEVDAVREIIMSAEKTTGSVNEELTNIITEETQAFFKGQKTAKETADIIQNRVQIYVNENR